MQSLKILIVDDDRIYNTLLKKVLSNNNNVSVCYSGEDAVNILQKEAYDLVLLDYKLGQVSGVDILKWICYTKLQLPVILITAFGSEDVALEAWKWRAQNYLLKGVTEITEIPKLVYDTYKKWALDSSK